MMLDGGMPVKIIFVCTGNTCRSPMAEYLFKHLIPQEKKESFEIISSGINAYSKMPISNHAKALLKEKNIDASSHYSTLFSPKLADSDTLILTMTRAHKDAIVRLYPEFSLSVYTLFEYVGEGSDIIDPFGGSLETYRACMLQIEALLNKLYLKT